MKFNEALEKMKEGKICYCNNNLDKQIYCMIKMPVVDSGPIDYTPQYILCRKLNYSLSGIHSEWLADITLSGIALLIEWYEYEENSFKGE